MKIAFVNLNYGFPLISSGISYLMTLSESKNHNVFLIDPTFHFENEINFVFKKIEKINPDIVCYSGTNYVFSKSILIANKIKSLNKNIVQVWGGLFATHSPERLILEKSVDAVFCGESEFQFLEYLDNIGNIKKLETLDGLWFKDKNNKIHKNNNLPLIHNLNSIPFANHDYWDIDKYMKTGLIIPGSIDIEASRGCPYDCTFCNFDALNKKFKNKYYRLKNPSRVIKEVKLNYEKYHNKGLNVINFVDPIFGVNKKHFEKFIKLYIKEGFNKKLPFTCQTRVEIITENWAKKISSAGCVFVSFGLESGNDYIRMQVYNKKTPKKVFLNAVRILKKYNILYRLNYIYDGPYETFNTLSKGLKFAKQLDATWYNIIKYWPLVGTKLHNRTINEGLILQKTASEIPVLIKNRSFFEKAQVNFLLKLTKFNLLTQTFFKSFKMRNITFIKDLIDYLTDKDKFLMLRKYLIYTLTLNVFMHTYLKYKFENWKK